jgi:tetratricopeptide (TPR) repeat protein
MMGDGKRRVKTGAWPRFLFPSLVSVCLFFPVLEGVLRLARYGYPAGYLKPLDIGGKPCFTGNPDFFRTFFPDALVPYADPFAIPREKGDSTYRIFILGESAAAGIPDPAFGFPRMLERMLEARHPGIRFEVINLAATAINSHVLLPIAKEAARQRPDLFILYMGNNEVIGPFGPGTVFAPFAGGNGMVRFVIGLKSTRTGQMLEDILAWARSRLGREEDPDPAPRKWAGMEMFLSRTVDIQARGDASFNFNGNVANMLSAIRASGAGALVSTVAVNQRDNPPFASLRGFRVSREDSLAWVALCDSAAALGRSPDSSLRDSALALYERAQKPGMGRADVHYRAAKLWLSRDRRAKAESEFRMATWLDALHFRADFTVNNILHTQVGRYGGKAGMRIAPADSLIAAASPFGIPGNEVFYEHVHFRPQGNYQLAGLLVPYVDSALSASRRFSGARAEPATDTLPSLAEVKASLALTGWDELGMAEKILALVRRPPFIGGDSGTGAFAEAMQADRRERIRLMEREVDSLKRYAAPESLQTALSIYQAAIASHPSDPVLHRNLGELFYATDYLPEAAEQYRAALAPLPHDTRTRQRLAKTLMEQGDLPGAISEYRAALESAPRSAEIHNGLANALAAAGEHAEAERHYRKALKGGSVLPEVRFNLSRTYIALGRIPEAIAQLEAALQADPGFQPASRELERLRASGSGGKGTPER